MTLQLKQMKCFSGIENLKLKTQSEGLIFDACKPFVIRSLLMLSQPGSSFLCIKIEQTIYFFWSNRARLANIFCQFRQCYTILSGN